MLYMLQVYGQLLALLSLFQKQSTTTGRQEKTKGEVIFLTIGLYNDSFYIQEFFERKRLQAKVKKVRPKSPQAGSSRVISKDLLYLQAISKIHDGRTGM